MTPVLSRRLAAAFGAPDFPTEVRLEIVAAAERANVFDDLPPRIQRLVEGLEQQQAE